MFVEIRKVENLEEKFAGLTKIAKKAIAISLTNIDRAPGSGKSSDLVSHHQGICKVDDAGSFIVSGSIFNLSKTSSDRPYFYIIKNNQGAKSVDGQDYYQIKNEDNPIMGDKFDYSDRRVMTHPGGIQVAENILAVGMEDYNIGMPSVRNDRSIIRFYDVGDEANIKEVNSWALGRWGNNKIASAVGITKRNDQWILAVRAGGQIELLINTSSQVGEGTFEAIGNPIPYGANNEIREFQGIDLFLNDSNKVYLFGSPDGGSNDDRMWLHELQFIYDHSDMSSNKIVGMASLPARYVNRVHFYRSGSGPRFKYAACIAVNKQNIFEVYSAEMHVLDKKIRCNGWNI